MRSRFGTIAGIWVLALCCAFLLVGCPGKDKAAEEDDPITWDTCSYLVGDHPCDFVLQDQNGQPWRLYDSLGSIVVLDFSTEWCGYCQIAASVAENLSNDYADADVVYVTVLVEDYTGNEGSVELASRWAEYFGMTSPVLAGSRDMLDPPTFDYTGTEGWQVSGWPTFFFIDRDMVLDGEIRGWSEIAIREYLDSMLLAESEEAEG